MNRLLSVSILVLSIASSAIAIECNKAGLDKLEIALHAVESNGGAMTDEATFQNFYNMAQNVSNSLRCLRIAQQCSPEVAQDHHYEYINDSWDYRITGILSAFSVDALKTYTSKQEVVWGWHHDGMARAYEPKLVTTQYKYFRVAVVDGDKADKMLQCYKNESDKIPAPKPFDAERYREGIRRSPL